MSGAAAVAPSIADVTITTVSRHLWTSSGLGRVLFDRQADRHAEIAQRRVIAFHALPESQHRGAGRDGRAVLARRRVLDERVHLSDETLRLELHGIFVHGGAHLRASASHEGATAAAQSREHAAGASLRRRVASSRAADPAQAVLELRDAARRGFQSVQETFLFGTGREWRRRGLGAGRVGDRRLRSERDRGETEQHGQAAHQDPLGVTRSHGYNVTMTVPATSRQTRTFEDRADALAHFFLRAGEAPRLLAYDDAVGCPLDQAIAALEWTVAVGILAADDLIHAARVGAESAAAVVERKDGDQRVFIYLGPRMDAPPADPYEGTLLYDEPGVRAYIFAQRVHAIAHFLRASHGVGAVISMLGRRAPELRHIRRWLQALFSEPLGAARSTQLLAGWFATGGAGVLFLPAQPGASYSYHEVGIDI